ncbi:damage-inducible protein CinA [Halarcobacter bivalviorum]|uniref:Damage-inducible protein CinA n=2 Tax=Halarcobacter bivalviorum TaxID=663364 RepID=A0AAX2A8G2_9BACT|nr:NMN amidohydrolase [Halarcobacter bivalviorum]RXK08936.1 damage-inducible protein CinA [Halarcobacter bivalviorum]
MYTNLFTQKDMIDFQNLLKTHKKTITTAESCTGGLIASKITEIAGSSNIFNGAVVTYSNEIKSQELNVKEETLNKFGAVSIQVVEEMLEGVIKKFNADYAIAVSGIAGPDGGTKNKPVGTVVIGIMGAKEGKDIEICHFSGSRNEVQIQAAEKSLKKISKFFQKTLDK